MAWLDERIWCHAKTVDLSDRAFRVYVHGIAYSSGFERAGLLTAGQQRTIGSDAQARGELIAAGLWEEAIDDAIQIHNWRERNDKRDERKARDRERKRHARLSADKTADKPADVHTLKSERVKSEEKSSSGPNLSPRYAAAFDTLAAIEKVGYGERKFTQERFAALVAQYPEANLLDEAERLRDWEVYGTGEKEKTRDGIQRLRNWLSKPARPQEDEPPATYSGGTYRRLTPADQAVQ